MCLTGSYYILQPNDNIQFILLIETDNVVCKKPHTGSVYSKMEMFNSILAPLGRILFWIKKYFFKKAI